MAILLQSSYVCLAGLLCILLNGVHGAPNTLMATGCSETWLTMACPGSDTIAVMDVRLVMTEERSMPCPQSPPDDYKVPQEVTHLCPTKQECIYAETICAGLNECAFYISPHMISGAEQPTTNSQVVVEYGCKMGESGGDRYAGVVILAILAVLLFLVLVIIIGCILWSRRGSDVYGVFDDSASVASSQAPPVGGATAARYETGTEKLDFSSGIKA